jgi:4-carboxymuconolactone decarboxylase
MTTPRIDPLPSVDGPLDINIMRTLAKHPKMLDAFGRLGGFLLSGRGFPAREREIAILRVGWRSGSVYEFGQHTIIGLREGLTDDEIARLTSHSLDGWSDDDAALVRAADELCAMNVVSDATWSLLAARWSESELIELVICMGFYRLVSGFLNTMGVELDDGVPGWPAR